MTLAELRREIDWQLQDRLTLSAPVIKRCVTPDEVLSGFNPAQRRRHTALAAAYNLEAWPRLCSAREYALNLYVLDTLDRHVPRPAAVRRGLDIGSGNWSYLPALASWAGTAWDGVELDAHRRDWTLVTRRAHARFMMRACPECRYVAGSLADIDGDYEVITWLLPFVQSAAFVAARLPRRFFAPRQMLTQAWSRLAPEGTMFVVNQGEAEAAAQRLLFNDVEIAANPLGLIESGFSPFRRPRYGWIVIKPALT